MSNNPNTKNFTDIRVGTYNVFLTTNRGLASTFTKAENYSSFMAEHQNNPEVSFLGTATNNQIVHELNITELKHEFNFSSKNENLLTLRTAEPGLEVLKRLYYLFMGERLTDLKLKKDRISKRGAKIAKDVEEINQTWGAGARLNVGTGMGQVGGEEEKEALLEDLSQNLRGQKVYIAYGIGENLDYWCGPLLTYLGRMEYKNDGKKEEMVYHFSSDHVRRQFDERERPGISQKVNFKKVSIPVLAIDAESRIQIKSKTEAQLEEAGVAETGLTFAEQITQDAGGDPDLVEPVMGGTEADASELGGGTLGGFSFAVDQKKYVVPFSGYTPSFHDNVVKLLSSYFNDMGITNHLIVLPNLDFIFAPLMTTIIGTGKFNEFLAEINPAFTPPPTADSDINYTQFIESLQVADPNAEVNDQQENAILNGIYLLNQFLFGGKNASGDVIKPREHLDILIRFFDSVGLLGNQVTLPSSRQSPKLINTTKQKKVEDTGGVSGASFIETGIYEITPGTNVHLPFLGVPMSFIPETSSLLPTNLHSDTPWLTQGKQREIEIIDWKDIPIYDPFSLNAEEQTADMVVNLEIPITVSEEQKEAPPTTPANYIELFLVAIQTMLDKHTKNSTWEITANWENKNSLVELFSKKFGRGTFSNYVYAFDQLSDTPKQIAPPEATEDAYFIFGEKSLIRDYVYGEIYTYAKEDENPRSSSYYLNRGIPMTNKYKQFPRYMVDPFWTAISNDIDSLIAQTDPNVFVPGKGLSGAKSPAELQEKFESYRLTGGLGYDPVEYFANLSKSYFAQVQELMYVKSAETHLGYFNDYEGLLFNSVGSLPDEFSFLASEESRHARTRLRDLNIPFFIGNEKSGNVLSYNFDADNFIFNQFFGSIQQIYYNMGVRYATLGGINNPLGGTMSDDKLFEAFYEALDQLRGQADPAGALYAEAFTQGHDAGFNITQLSNDLTDMLLTDTVGIKRKTRRGFSSDITTMVNLFRNLFENQFKGHIKTLPMFHLSTVNATLRPAVIFLKNSGKLDGSDPAYGIMNQRSTANFFSGMYKIVGFKHLISSKKSFSEFHVIKDIATTLAGVE
tara:strand:+ start:9635 stop:12871 length:3237 start_codon:yes stop_codon:yes gene_type:complete